MNNIVGALRIAAAVCADLNAVCIKPVQAQNCCLGAKIQKKHNSNRHHDENPSHYDSYCGTGKANTTMIPRWNILSLMLYRLVCSVRA